MVPRGSSSTTPTQEPEGEPRKQLPSKWETWQEDGRGSPWLYRGQRWVSCARGKDVKCGLSAPYCQLKHYTTLIPQHKRAGDICACALDTQVRLYMDCEEYHRVAFTRSPQPLTFEASSGIFVGNAGGTGLPRFVVSLGGTCVLRVCIPGFREFNRLRVNVKSACSWRNRREVWSVACFTYEAWTLVFAGSLTTGQKKMRNEWPHAFTSSALSCESP